MDPKSQLVEFFLQHKAKTFTKGEILLHNDKVVQNLYYVQKGFIRVYTYLTNGNEKIYVFYKPEEIFPILWTFNNINKNLFYQAMEDTTVYIVPKEEFLQFVSDKPKILLELIHRIIQIHNIYVDRVDNLEYTNAYSRLIARFIFLAERFGKQEGKRVHINIPITHTDIANTIAMTRETASREIEKLEKKGLLTKDKLFTITDIEKLKQELDDFIDKKRL